MEQIIEKFYYIEWKLAEKDNNDAYAQQLKEYYRSLVMKRLVKKHNEFYDKLKMFPIINMN